MKGTSYDTRKQSLPITRWLPLHRLTVRNEARKVSYKEKISCRESTGDYGDKYVPNFHNIGHFNNC